MKKQLIIISRLFSGLKETIAESKWKPSGIPAFIKLAEEAKSYYDVTWVLVAKTKSESLIFDDYLKSKRINCINFILIPYKNITHINRIDTLLNIFFSFFRFNRLLSKNNDQVFYVDRSNIIIAAILKLFYKRCVVVRILGIYPDQNKITKNIFSKVYYFFEYISYKINYDLVIGTQDGSGTEYYITKLMNKKTKKEVLINGTNKSQLHFQANNEKIKFLFIGTLVESKGILELIQAFEKMVKFRGEIELKVIGKGPLEANLKDQITKSKIDDYIKLLGHVSHSEINKYFQESDIYISLNKLGSLSNSVLEAISNGKCIFVLSQDTDKKIDVFTHNEFFPSYSVVKIDRNNIVESLSKNVLYFLENKSEIKKYSKIMESIAEKKLRSWPERINKELEMIQDISK